MFVSYFICSTLSEEKIPKYRFKQLEDAVFKQLVTSFEEVTVYPKDLREKLDKKFKLNNFYTY